MECKRITRQEDPLFEGAHALYEAAFPRAERRDMEEISRILQNEDYHMDVLMEGKTLLGILFYWQTEDYIFLEHFATMAHLRNQGLGSRALGLLQQKKKPIILEIEPPVDELTNHRYGFYRRNGFVMNPFDHIQAQLRREDPPLSLKILSWPGQVSPSMYRSFVEYMNRYISVQR